MAKRKPKLVFPSEEVGPFRREAPGDVFVFYFLAKPDPKFAEHREQRGAYVTCWVNTDDRRAAEMTALNELYEMGWIPTKVENWWIMDRDCYADVEHDPDFGPHPLKMLEVAMAEGVSTLAHAWPISDSDGDPDVDG